MVHDLDPAAAPAHTHAERCRALVAAARTATLSTLAREPEGFPFGSLVTVAFDAAGRPLLLLSELAAHTQNLLACSSASLLVVAPGAEGADLSVERLTLVGVCERLSGAAAEAASGIFLAAHPAAAAYVAFKDFAFYGLRPVGLRYVGGFGRMSWVDLTEYERAGLGG
ncbi:MAG: pyridoxamine 5'-phosphate oxidase family protein [Myxococcales bacterium]|nr:pyridoxamine 5'-phosphate oxidase family protein [Myxococcales bacterium]HQY61576.1 pyridoxamine 5'-phosphate oxidase family protein [Polyangiaceae bacterium]